MESYILLENVKIYAYHGVFEQESLVGNYFIINIKLKVDIQDAIGTDDLNSTISYAAVYEIIKEQMSIPSKLLEHVAGRIISAIKNEYKNDIKSIEFKISKLNPPVGGEVEAASILIID